MTKLNEWAKIELIAVTSVLILSFILSLVEQTHFANPLPESTEGISQLNFKYISSTFLPVLFNHLIICICYLLLCFYVTPELESKTASKSITFVFYFIFAAIFLDIIDTYWAILLALKVFYILFTCNKANLNNFSHECGIMISSWILVACSATLLSVQPFVKMYTLFIIPAAIFTYLYSIHYLIPKIFHKKWKRSSYFWNMLLLTGASCLALAAIITLTAGNLRHWPGFRTVIYSTLKVADVKALLTSNYTEEFIKFTIIGNLLTQMIIIVPLSWKVYKSRNTRKTEEIKALRTELGKSDANLNFLKSQINPHFLFNALNTLYGTALQENAERTGEGIQRLGDMMRFMLQENLEDKIPLSRDVNYLTNYIDLQKLRTATTADITIKTEIEEQLNNLQIAPMLLIPFVENAFKHGISLQYPSHIKITLQTRENQLYFDVHNSIHLKSDTDPEKFQSGIGLQNVKQRLALQYPGHHDLTIRENAKEFFVHLTIQLEEND